MTATNRPSCLLQGYSDCGPVEFRRGEGTSFSAPQVSAAAALVLGTRPQLQPDQVSALLTRSALDASTETGCKHCSSGRDPLTGWGVLDVASAIDAAAGVLPEPDSYESNDQAGAAAPQLWGRKGQRISATIDYWDDQVDVCSIRLRRGEQLTARLRGPWNRCEPLPLAAGDAPRLGHFRQQAAASRPVAVPGLARAHPHPRTQDRLVLPRGEEAAAGSGSTLSYRKRPSATHRSETSRICRAGCRRRPPAPARRGRRQLQRDLGLFADLDSRTEDGRSSDSRPTANRRAAALLVALLGAPHEVVVRRRHAWSDEDLLLERRGRP